MRYLDSGRRQAAETLADWLVQAFDGQAAEIRIQTGYFSDDPLRLVQAELTRVAQNGTVHAVVGSNRAMTTAPALKALCAVLAMPNGNVQVRVVSYANALYHPKAFHVRRSDGSQAAYVGSANLTSNGTTLNVEAGIALDTAAGDDPTILDQIALAVDAWLALGPAAGVHQVAANGDVDALVAAGIVSALPPPRPPAVLPAAPGGGGGAPHPALQPALGSLVQIPPGVAPAPAPAAAPVPLHPPVAAPHQPIPAAPPPHQAGVPVAQYPAGVLFVGPNPVGASSGPTALTGAVAPQGAVGLIYALQNAIVTKTLGNQGGTADLNLPLDILPLVRFGLFGNNALPRAEFDIEVRYLDHQGSEPVQRRTGTTNITYYGVGPIAGAKAGHRDVRLLIPATAKALAADVRNAHLPLPMIGHYLLLEFPTINTPAVRLSFLDPGGPLHAQVAALAAANPNVGHGNAWWLPAGVSPPW